jgi:hypothetical protein
VPAAGTCRHHVLAPLVQVRKPINYKNDIFIALNNNQTLYFV